MLPLILGVAGFAIAFVLARHRGCSKSTAIIIGIIGGLGAYLLATALDAYMVIKAQGA
jgi:zinc transporter ZupT